MSSVLETGASIINNATKILFVCDYDFDGESCYVIGESWATRARVPFKMHMSNNDFPRGIHDKMVDDIIESYVDGAVVITADTGSDAIDAFKRLKDNCPYIKIIVTDHHTIPDLQALYDTVDLVVNAQDDSTKLNKAWCGANVLYELLSHTNIGDIKHLQGYVSMANLVDQMDMTNGDNIDTYYKGQEYLKEYDIINFAKKDFRSSRHHDRFISIRLAPIINSCHRFGVPDLGVRVLKGDYKAYQEACIINSKRKKTTTELYHMMKKQIAANKQMLPYLMMTVTYGKENKPYCGLLASKIVQEYNVPALVLNISENKIGGSGRTITDFNLKSTIDKLSIPGLKVMGHEGAFGIQADSSDTITELATLFPVYCKNNNVKYNITTNAIKSKLTDLDSLVVGIEALRPFGNNNPYPKYSMTLEVVEVKFRKKAISVFNIKYGDSIMECLYFGKLDFDYPCSITANVEIDIDKKIKLIVSEITSVMV